MIQTDGYMSLALLLASALAEVCQLGDAAARTARLEGQGTDARVTVDPEAWAKYRRRTIRAGLGAFGLPSTFESRNN